MDPALTGPSTIVPVQAADPARAAGPDPAAAPWRAAAAARPDGSAGPGRRAPADGPAAPPRPDPLLHPDPDLAADHAALESLLRCWVRETGVAPPPDGVLRIPVAAGAARLTAPVRHWSAAGWHRFGPALLAPAAEHEGHRDGGAPAGAPRDAVPVDAVTAAALLTREAGPASAADIADLAGRVADSVRRTARFLAHRRSEPAAAARPPLPFLEGEQALLLGHPLHPTPKSREGIGGAEADAYSPELRGSFRLHWFAADRDLAAADSALAVPAARIAEDLLGGAAVLPPGTVALPLHPWQAKDLALRPAVRALLDEGRLHDLGAHGDPWYPTSSVRTVCRPGTPWMLKLSLGLRITNSRRENLRKELHRGVEVHRLLESGLAAEWHAHHPCYDIVRDPAWLGVDIPGLPPGTAGGLDTAVRLQPFGPADRVLCVAGLVAERPLPDPAAPGRAAAPSLLADLLHGLARRTGRPLATVAAEWFLRYLDAAVLPVLWLDGRAGVALEAHQQNSLVLLDADGWPAGGRYRDNQGYYFRSSRADALDARLPGIGTRSDTFVDDRVADERFAYYLGINHLLGLVGAFGSQRLADERLLLAALRRFLAADRTAATGSTLPARLLDSPTLRCKANLLTRLRGMDELVGPVETQSVYVTVPNPVAWAGSPHLLPGGPA
ncbi:IucA/IucC family protein [Streptomyces sp. NPDC001380]|uniref:IucA/IucC family protein n=1 Tax=Streptomyces sp. NPDC001380 TaxID=3364566 RepID=UPI003674B3AC